MKETTPPSLFGEFDTYRKPSPTFSGATYSPALDQQRLETLLARVFELMKDGRWRTLVEIREACGGSEASISARLRDYRKPEHGGHVMEGRRREGAASGVWEYRVLVAGR